MKRMKTEKLNCLPRKTIQSPLMKMKMNDGVNNSIG